MTSSSIPTTFPSTKLMFGKYSDDSVLTEFFPMQTNVSYMSLPVNTSDTCCSMLARTCWWTIPCIESRPLFRAPKMGRAQASGYEMEHTNLNYWERMGGCEEI